MCLRAVGSDTYLLGRACCDGRGKLGDPVGAMIVLTPLPTPAAVNPPLNGVGAVAQ